MDLKGFFENKHDKTVVKQGRRATQQTCILQCNFHIAILDILFKVFGQLLPSH